MKYISRTKIKIAEQFLSTLTPPKGVSMDGKGYYVTTIQEQRVRVQLGEYIIQEPDGIHYYPCAAKIFEEGYDLIGE